MKKVITGELHRVKLGQRKRFAPKPAADSETLLASVPVMVAFARLVKQPIERGEIKGRAESARRQGLTGTRLTRATAWRSCPRGSASKCSDHRPKKVTNWREAVRSEEAFGKPHSTIGCLLGLPKTRCLHPLPWPTLMDANGVKTRTLLSVDNLIESPGPAR